MMSLRSALLGAVLLFTACPSSTGPQGPEGPQGPAGAQGAAGPQGVAGVAGPIGPKGDTGDEGQQGQPGPVGPAGMVLVLDGGIVTGPAGAPVVLVPLAPGSACATGGVRVTQLIDGGVVDVCNGASGPSPAVSMLPNMSAQCPTGGLLIGLPDGGSMPLCNGAQGSQGPQGATGSQGAQGVAGAIGPMGPAGPTGMTGAGPVGPAGATGPVGPAGPQGVAGPTGMTGVAGPAGPAGATGGVGPAGPQGNVGPAGAAGPAGPTGAAGPQGPVGPAGSVLYLDGGVAVVSAAPVQFLGFTQAVFTGAMGGLPGVAEKCRAEFTADSYLCTMADYDLANTAAVPPTTAGAWVDYNRNDNGTRSTSGCAANQSPWTSAAVQFPPTAPQVTEVGYRGLADCTASKHLACCRVSRGNFRGFTAATYNGNLGGLPGAATKCRIDFPGSSLCTLADYDLSNTATRPPTAAGAWVDYNRNANGTRSTSGCAANQSPWTSAAVQFPPTAPHISAVGYAGIADCTAVKHLACCGGL